MSEGTKKYKQKWIDLCKNGELICGLCLKKIEKVSDITYDHWIPRALGGPTNEENGVPAHPWCNSAKGCIPPDIFEQHREEILSGTYKLSQPYSLKPKQTITYKEPVIVYQNGREVQKTYRKSHFEKTKSAKQLKREEKENRKKKRIDRKRKIRKDRKKLTKTMYQTSYKIVVPTTLNIRDMTLGQTVGELRRIILGDKIRYDVARYVVVGFIDNKPVARELFETSDKRILSRLVEIKKPLDYKQAKLFARNLNNYVSQRQH